MRNLLPLFLVLFLLVYLPFLSAQDFSLNAVSSTYHSQISPNNTSLYQGGIQVYGNVSLSWDSVSGASCYNIYYKGWVGYYQGQPSATELFESTCNYTLNRTRTIYYRDSFTPDSTYFFKVKSVDSNNNEFAESNIVRVNFQDWCSDSDGGKNYNISGYTKDSFENKSYSDVCSDDYKSVFEYFCMYDAESSEHYNVSMEKFKCPAGYYCSNGECTNIEANKCIDTDGWNEGRKGLRIVNLNGNISVKSDYCITGPVTQFPERDIIDDPSKKVENCTGKNCYLIEYQCNNENLSDEYTVFWCGNDCIDGACVVYTLNDQGFWTKVFNWLKDVLGI